MVYSAPVGFCFYKIRGRNGVRFGFLSYGIHRVAMATMKEERTMSDWQRRNVGKGLL